MKAEAQRADAKGDVHTLLESPPLDDYGSPGETLGKRLTRLDAELDKERTNIGARGEPVDCVSEHEPASTVQLHQTEVVPNDDDRWRDLALDSLFRVQALVVSSAAGVPYVAARNFLDLRSEEKAKLTQAARQVIDKHPAFFSEHREAIEVVVGLTAIQGAWLDHLMLATTADRPPTWWEVLGSLLILFSPLLLFLALYGFGLLQRGDR
jgi:hypothetical protein